MWQPLSILVLVAGFCLVAPGCKRVIRGTADLLGAPQGGGSEVTTSSVTVASSNRDHEGTEGLGPIVVRLERSQPDSRSISIEYTTEATQARRQQATPYLDYRPVAGTLRWGPDDGSEKTITIEILDDEFFEPTESFAVRFTSSVGEKTVTVTVECRIFDASPTREFAADVDHISAATGGVQRLVLRAGVDHAKRQYLIAGALGTTPGIELAGVHVPLNVDWWLHTSLALGNTAMLWRFRGVLDTQGDAVAEIRLGPIAEPAAIGLEFFHAYVVFGPLGIVRLASNAVPVTIVP